VTTARFYFPLALVLALWQVVVMGGILPSDMLPSPSQIGEAMWKLAAAGDLALHVGVSVYRQMAGLLLAAVVGIALGIGMAHFAWVRTTIEPIVRVTYPLPKSALIPMLILVFGIGHNSKIFAVFLGCLLPVVLSAYNGTRGVDNQLVWSARSLGTGPVRMMWKVYFSAALPEILSGLRIALALSYTLLVSSELLIARAGLGYLIQTLGEAGEYPGMFAGVFIFALIGFATDRLYVNLMNWLLRWREQEA
jgi:ABC-type nitrate/sulfonate/bicarbonate transport system permease component